MMDDLQLLMVHADDHSQVVDGVHDDACRHDQDGFEQEQPSHLWDEGADPNALDRQRWCVIAPSGATGDKLIGLIQPLIDARSEQQQGQPVKIFRVPPGMTARNAARWKKTVFDPATGLRDELARYQLILGDLDEVSLELQLVQQVDGFVGRLAFDKDAQYEAYVDKLLRWERNPVETAASLFATVHDRTPATTIGYRELVAPSIASARAWQTEGRFTAEKILEVGDPAKPDRDAFVRAAANGQPSVMLSVSHGEGAPRGGWKTAAQRQARQGSMSFGTEGHLSGADLAGQSFLPGGFWLMLACFGAGTPAPGSSKYKHWLEYLKQHRQFRGIPEVVLTSLPRSGEPPFIASLPKTVLANEKGPLSFIGHIDLAWTYAFKPLDSESVKARPALFTRILRSVLKGDRAGVAFREIPLALSQAETELTIEIDADARMGAAARARHGSPKRGHLWMLRQDLLGYVLLGDPAARLPVERSRDSFEPRDSMSQLLSMGIGGQARPTPPPKKAASAPPRDPAAQYQAVASRLLAELDTRMLEGIDTDALEEAVGKLWSGEATASALAAELGMDKVALRRVATLYSQLGRLALGRD